MNFSGFFNRFSKSGSGKTDILNAAGPNASSSPQIPDEAERLAQLYRIIKGTQAPTFTDVEIDYPKPLQSIQVKHPQEMICSQAYMLSLINQQLGMKEDAFVRYVLTTVENYAAWVQLLPASESYHHTAIGGLFAHSLDVSLRALKIFENRNVYVEGTALEREGALIKFRLASFLGGLLHDIGKIFEDITVTAPDGRMWCSQVEPLYTWAVRNGITKYQYVWRKGRHLESHELYTAYYLPRIVPQHVFRWLGECEPNVSKVLIGALSGNSDSAYGRIWDIVQKADSSSTKADVDLHGSTDNGKEYEIPVGMYFCRAVSSLLANNTWSVNTPSSEVFVFDSGVFVIWSRRTFEAMMNFFDKEGYTGIPHQSFTMAQLIAESTVAVTNSIYPADTKQDPEPYPLWRVKLNDPKGEIVHMAIRVKQAARIFEASTVPFPIHGELLDITPEDLLEKPNYEWDLNAAAQKQEPKKNDEGGRSQNAETKPGDPEAAPQEAKPVRQREPCLQREPAVSASGAASSEAGKTEPEKKSAKPETKARADEAAPPKPKEVPSRPAVAVRAAANDDEDDDDFIREQGAFDDEETGAAAGAHAVSQRVSDEDAEEESSESENATQSGFEDRSEVDEKAVESVSAETSKSPADESCASEALEEVRDEEEADGTNVTAQKNAGSGDDPYGDINREDEEDSDDEAHPKEPEPNLPPVIEREERKPRSPNRLKYLYELRGQGPAANTLVLTHPLIKTMCRTLRAHEVYTGPAAQLMFEIAIAMSVGRVTVMWLQKHSVIPKHIRDVTDESLLADSPDAVQVVLLPENGMLIDGTGRKVERLSALVSLFPGRYAALSQAVDRLKDAGLADIVTVTEGEGEYPVKTCFSVKPLIEKATADLIKDKASPEGLSLKSFAHLAVMSLASDFDRALEDDGPYLLTEGTVKLLNEVCSTVGESTVTEGLGRPSSANPDAGSNDDSAFRRTYASDERRTAVSPRFEDVFCILRDQIRQGGGNWTVNLKLNEGGAVLSAATFENIVRDFPEFTPVTLSDYVFSGSASHLGFSLRGNKICFNEDKK